MREYQLILTKKLNKKLFCANCTMIKVKGAVRECFILNQDVKMYYLTNERPKYCPYVEINTK